MSATITCTTPQGRDVTVELAALLLPDSREQVRGDANDWIKRLRLVQYDGVSMRQRFRYRGDSLWWFTELYLHKGKRLDVAVSTVLALESARHQYQPTRITVQSVDPDVRDAAEAFGRAHGLTIDLQGSPRPRPGLAWPSYLIPLSARLSRLRRAALPVPHHPAVAAFVHTAFWRATATAGKAGPQQESYVGAVLDAVAAEGRDADLHCVGVGPRKNFRNRRWWDPVVSTGPRGRLITPIERLAPSAALAGSRDLWRQRQTLSRALTAGAGIRAAAIYRGCDLWPVLRPQLEAVALLQWPWSARAMDEAGAALDALRPGSVVTYAEAGGWGRALILEARRRGIPSVGLQHGFIYRHWLNYRHEPDEIAPQDGDGGCPIPDRTLVFDRYAEAHLRATGHFPAEAIAVTGNARLDDLAEEFAALSPSRAQLRQSLGIAADQPLAVLAAKFTEIRSVLPDLVAAVAALPGARLLIKAHPAENPADYLATIGGATNVSVAAADADLASLLVAADAMVTMNSTVAIDGLVLGVPALVIGLPNNLSPFVNAGAMLGADGADQIRERLQSLLYDRGARQAVIARGAAFAGQYALGSDGFAAQRAAAAILALAAHPAGRRV